MNPSILSKTISEIVEQTELCNLNRTTSLGEGKILNSKAEKCSSGESVAYLCTILPLSAHTKSGFAGSTQTFTSINKSSM